MERYDSLPRVEETEEVDYEGDASDTELIKTMYEASLAAGEVVEPLVSESAESTDTESTNAESDVAASEDHVIIPKAPNTGKQ